MVDLGAGAGAATSYIASQAPEVSFVAADLVNDLLDMGKNLAHAKGIKNLTFRKLDWFDLKKSNEFDGVISLQTLSWLPEAHRPLRTVLRNFNPNWLALTSLFYEGDISCTVEILEHRNNRKMFYNVYSLPEVRRVAHEVGYRLSNYQKFEISFDLPRPKNLDVMGTYTKKVLDSPEREERLQISGPVLMPWYMLLLERND